MGSQQKKKKRTQDSRSLTGEIKRTQDLDVNKLALEPTFELGYSPVGVGTVSFVNVSTSLGPAQGSSGPPAQVTGLTVTPQGGSNTQLNLAWTAITAPDFNYYNVYRGITSGFVVDISSEIAQPVTNSYNNTGLTAGTTYYYRVSVTNDAELEGTPSSQVSATTTSPPAPAPDLWLQFNNSLIDSSANANSVTFTPTAPNVIYGSPGKFGSHYAITNYPDQTTVNSIIVSASTSTALDLTTGFSLSFWAYTPSDIPTQSSTIASKWIDTNNHFHITWPPTSAIFITTIVKAGTTIRRSTQSPFLSRDTWYHCVVTFDGSTNTMLLYVNKVEQATVTSFGSFTPSTTTSWRIGQLSGDNNNDHVFKGRIDEFQYFKGKILTQGQINNLFATNAP